MGFNRGKITAPWIFFAVKTNISWKLQISRFFPRLCFNHTKVNHTKKSAGKKVNHTKNLRVLVDLSPPPQIETRSTPNIYPIDLNFY